jgi:UTP-glucose-1-phosphate uridylyltransferase
MQMITKVNTWQAWTLVLLAAGHGSRFGGLKQLHAFGEQKATLAEFAIFDALRNGCGRFIAVVNAETKAAFERIFHHMNLAEASCIEQCIHDIPCNASVDIRQRRQPWGTGHALWTVRDVVSTPFMIVNADDFYGPSAYHLGANYLAQESKHYGLVTYPLAKTLSSNGFVSRGLCAVDENDCVTHIRECTRIGLNYQQITVNANEEILSPDTLVSMNFWILRPNIFDVLEELFIQFLKDTTDISTEEFYLPEAICSASKLLNVNLASIPNKYDAWLGVTYAKDVLKVNKALHDLTISKVYPKNLWEQRICK